jgi:hypothetical protein
MLGIISKKGDYNANNRHEEAEDFRGGVERD